MELPSKQQTPGSDVHYQYLARLVGQVNALQQEIETLRARLGISPTGAITQSRGLSSRVNIPAAEDPNAALQVYGQGFTTPVPGSTTITTLVAGVTFGAGPGYVFAISSASSFRGAIGAAAKSSITGTTLTLAKITGPGTDGSITISAEGVVTAYVAPT